MPEYSSVQIADTQVIFFVGNLNMRGLDVEFAVFAKIGNSFSLQEVCADRIHCYRVGSISWDIRTV